MKLNAWKTNVLKLSLLCLLVGLVIGVIGYALTGFSLDAYVRPEGYPWYWIGIGLN